MTLTTSWFYKMQPTGAPALPADWSQFLPDLVPSLIVGILLGIVLYLWQRRLEQRQEQRLAEASWSTVRSRVVISVAVEPPKDAWLDHELKDPFVSLETAVDGIPLVQWSEALPKNRELQLLRAIASDIPFLAAASKEVLAQIDVELMMADAAWVFSKDRDYVRDAALRTLRGDTAAGFAGMLMSAFKLGTQKEYDRLDEAGRQAANGEGAKSAYADFVKIYDRVRGKYVEVRGLLRSGPDLVRRNSAESG